MPSAAALTDDEFAAAKAKVGLCGTAMGSNDGRAACLVRALEQSITGDVSGLEDLYTRRVTGSSPVLSVTSLEELAVELEEREDAFSDVEIAVDPLDVSGDQACVEWVASAIHSGPLPLDERENVVLEPSGRRIVLRGLSVAEFSGDRISAFRHYWDDVQLLAELGLLDGD